MTYLKLQVPPLIEPVSLCEIKTHARIDADNEDALLSTLIVAARLWAENYTGRSFLSQTWRLGLDVWPANSIVELPRVPLLAISGVFLRDENDEAMPVPLDTYYADMALGRLAPRGHGVWPLTMRTMSGIEIDYIAGYGENPDSVPELIRLAIRQLATHWYEHRGEAVIMSAIRNDAIANLRGVNAPYVIQALLNPFRLRQVAI